MKKVQAKKLFLLLPLLLLSTSCSGVKLSSTYDYSKSLSVGNKKIYVEIADTDAKKTQGLSGREKLSDSQGMLFDFRTDGEIRPGFWMKEMKFNLDLIWIRQGEIIFITPNAPAPRADEGLTEYYPPSEIDMVLEVNAGWSEKYNIKIGDVISLQ